MAGFRVVLTASSADALETVVLSMVKNPGLLMDSGISAGPIEPVAASDPIRDALIAYRRSHKQPLAEPYDDCTCHLCRAADLALTPKKTTTGAGQ